MKFLIALLALLISVSAYGQHRDRHHNANGMHYGGHNPPVGMSGAHCMYSAWGCSGAGGSLGYHGYRHGHRPYMGHGGYPMHGGWNGNCGGGNYVNRRGNIGYYNGRMSGSFGFSRGTSTGGCNGNGNGYSSSHQSGSIGIHNGQVNGNMGYSQSQSN